MSHANKVETYGQSPETECSSSKSQGKAETKYLDSIDVRPKQTAKKEAFQRARILADQNDKQKEVKYLAKVLI